MTDVQIKIAKSRLKKLQSVVLKKGTHDSADAVDAADSKRERRQAMRASINDSAADLVRRMCAITEQANVAA